MHVPITDRVRYLGVIISFRNMEQLTLAHRLNAASIACRRLSRWLYNKKLSIVAKLHMWRSCIYSIIQFGILAVGVTYKGLEQLQQTTILMLRKIVADHSFRAILLPLEPIGAFGPWSCCFRPLTS